MRPIQHRFNWKNALRKAHNINKKIFKISCRYKYKICHTDKQYKRCTGNLTDTYAITESSGRMIFRSLPLLREARMRSDYLEVEKTAVHEMNHVFWIHKYRSWYPAWLSEGFACYIAQNYIMKKSKLKQVINNDTTSAVLIETEDEYNKLATLDNYKIWANFTEYLIDTAYSLNDFVEKIIPNYIRYRVNIIRMFDTWKKIVLEYNTVPKSRCCGLFSIFKK